MLCTQLLHGTKCLKSTGTPYVFLNGLRYKFYTYYTKPIKFFLWVIFSPLLKKGKVGQLKLFEYLPSFDFSGKVYIPET